MPTLWTSFRRRCSSLTGHGPCVQKSSVPTRAIASSLTGSVRLSARTQYSCLFPLPTSPISSSMIILRCRWTMPLLNVARRTQSYPLWTTGPRPMQLSGRTSFSDRTWRMHVPLALLCSQRKASPAPTQFPLLTQPHLLWPLQPPLCPHPPCRNSPMRRFSMITMDVSSAGGLMQAIGLTSAPMGSPISTNMSQLLWPRPSVTKGTMSCSPHTPSQWCLMGSIILMTTYLVQFWEAAARSLIVPSRFFFLSHVSQNCWCLDCHRPPTIKFPWAIKIPGASIVIDC